MESAESGRQIAADLHEHAVIRGQEPWNPFQFVMAEVARRGYDAEAVSQGATMLNGGRATLIADEALILYENVGTPFEKAFLIAHEIGHIELGDATDTAPAVEIDMARASEAAPVGIDRVVDYSARQRREVQMDLFAREFLLPRVWVRKLHVDDNIGALAIAKRLGAPFEVVAQQLLDALLLPQIVYETSETHPERTPNDLQQVALNHRGKPYLLEAGPGTGKTQTLVKRIEGLLAEGVDPRRILVLTFSNKAAGEMAERIASRNQGAATAMWIGTFHAFGLDVVRRFYSDLNFDREPRLMDRTEAVELLEEEFPRLRLEHYRNLYDPTEQIVGLLSAISRAKDEVVDATKYAGLASAMLAKASSDEERKAAEKALEAAKVYEAYEGLKRSKDCIDFGDLVMLPVKLMESRAHIQAHFRALYDHVLVDEYQDVNRSSVRLLMALCGSGKNLWAVGDAKQSIYRFRGASSFSMSRFGSLDFTEGVGGRLEINYRSFEEIVHTFSAFSTGMAASTGPSALKADRGLGGYRPELRTTEKSENQTVALADAIEEMREAGYSYRDQAVLCSGNDRLAVLAEELERLGIPVLFLGSLFERPEVKDIFAFLSILTDRRAMGLIRLACWPEFRMSMEDVTLVLAHLRSTPREPTEWLENPAVIPGVSDSGKDSLTALAAALDGFSSQNQPWQIIAAVLLDRTRIAARLAGSTEVADRTRCIAIWQLMNFMRANQPSSKGLPVPRLLERVRRLLRLGDDKDLRHLPAAAQKINAVRLMTMHGAKGLEFKVVHIPGMNQGTLPRTSKPPVCAPPDGMVAGAEGSSLAVVKAEHEKEQECLFYVALSRARDRLLMYAPTKTAADARRQPSSYVTRIQSLIGTRHVTPARELPVAEEDADIEIVLDCAFSFDASQISLYESCPRRFFYTHLLQIGGRRTKTPLIQMHDAVRTVFQRHIEEGGNESEEHLDRKVTAALKEHGLENHGYLAEYEEFARTMVRYFASSRKGMVSETPKSIVLSLGGEQIVVRPDDVLVRPDGGKTLRRIKTGHSRSKEDKQVDTAAFVLAAQKAFPGAKVEMVHLADQSITEPSLSFKELKNREEKLSDFMTKIRSGQFPTESSRFSCPSCPAFFICGPVPDGKLQKG
jgi:superfamily I DNA/RNA helicase